jgi:dihydropteroate synthase
VAIHLAKLTGPVIEALSRHANRLGLEILTGEDWALLAGSRARFGALARPWTVPPELAEVAVQVGLVLAPEAPREWLTARGSISLEKPVILGILNVTPDSFSDGGKFGDPGAALAHAERLLADGADVLDVGGESTRPGRPSPVREPEELARVIPVIEGIVARHPNVPVSVDTVKSGVARAALAAGAAVINDVSAFRLDSGMGSVASASCAGVILMHSRGNVTDMATMDHARYDDVTADVTSELRTALDGCLSRGIPAERIVLDPGLGFAKSPEQNLILCDRLAALQVLGRPILVGPSRKRFLGQITGREVAERDVATAAACVLAWDRGARLFRVHNVAMARDALAVAAAVRGAD